MRTTAIKLEKDKFEEISGLVKDAVQASGIVNGACIVTVSDPAAGLAYLEEGNEAAMNDIAAELARVFPPRVDYKSGGDAYVCSARTKAALLCMSKECAIVDGKAEFGKDRGLYAVHFLGSDTAQICIQCI